MNFKFLNLSDHDIKKASREIKSEGFYVFDNLISGDIVETLKIFWKSKFELLIKERPKANAVRGNLHLGEIDFDTFSKRNTTRIHPHHRTHYILDSKLSSSEETLWFWQSPMHPPHQLR